MIVQNSRASSAGSGGKIRHAILAQPRSLSAARLFAFGKVFPKKGELVIITDLLADIGTIAALKNGELSLNVR